MMFAYVVLGLVLGLPLLLGLLFRVGTSHLFLSLLAGELLGRTFGDEAGLIIHTAPNGHVVSPYAEVAILVLPVLLTALFLRHTLTKGKALLHVLPFALTGIIFAAFALPALPEAAQAQITSVEIGRLLLDNSQIIVGVVVFLQLIALWLINRPKEGHGKKHH